MTDLENLWEDLPTGKPPVADVLEEGRARAERRRRATRPLLMAGATAALVGAFVAGSVVGGSTGPSGGPAAGGPSPVAFQADLDPATSCDELLESYRDRALGLVTAWGWGQAGYDGGVYPRAAYGSNLDLSASRFDAAGAGGVVPDSVRAQSSSRTGTNVQESGVDEPDTVKTDGTLVVRLRGDDLVVYDTSGTSVVQRSTTHLPRLEDGELLLSGSTVVVIGVDQTSARDDLTGERRGTRVVTVSVKDPEQPTVRSTVTYASRVVSARQHGATVRLVLAAGLPGLDFVQPDGKKVTEQQALTANRRVVKESTVKDWLPSYDTGAGAEQLLDCTDVAVPPDALRLDTVSIVGFTADDPEAPRAIGLAGAATTAYESADHLYLADGPAARGVMTRGPRVVPPTTTAGADTGTTHLYDFELDGVDAVHVASGEVEGTVADRWSMDEADDVLRVAVGPSSETGEFNSVVTFRREGQVLAEVGRLDGLGPDEELKGVRWFDDLAVVVTFREVDPLFTVDLADPTRPKLVGKLKIPGYSDYLHPLTGDELMGVGYDGRGGAQVGLFDTSDLADVRRTDVVTYRRTQAVATQDPRSFTYLPELDTVLTVLQEGQRVDVATLTVRDGTLTSTRTRVEYGADAAQVRTIGLPDGRVVLVTGEDVRFFPVR